MRVKEKASLVPRLRFPEFRSKPGWKDQFGGDLFDQISDKNLEPGLPVLAVTQEHGAIPRHMIDYHVSVTEKSIESYKVVQVGDFVISLRSFQGGIEYSQFQGICSPAYVVLRRRSEGNDAYFRHYLKTDRFIQILTRNLEGLRDGKMISYRQFSELRLPVPTAAEQQKIADCLSSLDELIAAQVRKVDVLKTHKKGLMQQLLPREGETQPRLRFPEFQYAGSWTEKNLGAICTIQRGKFSHRPRNDPRFFGGKYPFIQTGDVVKSNGGAVRASQTLNEQGLSVSKLFKPPIVLITIAANIGDTGLLEHEACFTDSVAGLIPKDGVFAEFLELAVRGKKEYLKKIAPAAAQKNINNEILSVLPILMPEFKEQKRIADCLTSLDNLITVASQELETFKAHKKGLMQQLFPFAQAIEA
ncbi:restriction endonuclease subunit S [Variovorax sp. PAMC26660]|uniref:restriction endonuclease subunit S n=1 Tax=Variovorax sp. PAMC26660 TaxID=2762322 RepID=UPI00164E5689|nr:restriction endonuclease subunit S [Variovorax sp. PAMC26660]QNK71139.1 restriction endonuclease subunit S [Variovorax sp. PAMC26660]